MNSGAQSGNPLQAEKSGWQEGVWTAQRVAWVLMVLFLAAVVAGITGKGGPLASGTIKTEDGEIQYPRISRWQSAESLEIRLAPTTSGEVELIVSPSFARAFAIDSITPQPKEAASTSAGFSFIFESAPPGRRLIVMNLTAGRPALSIPVEFKIGQARPAKLTVTVLP